MITYAISYFYNCFYLYSKAPTNYIYILVNVGFVKIDEKNIKFA